MNMNKIKFLMRHLVIAITSCIIFTTQTHAEPRRLSDRGESLDRIVAVVNEGIILNTELDNEIAKISARLKQQKTELPSASVLRSQVLDRLIQQELQLQRAEKGGLKVTDDMVNAMLNDIATSNGVKFSDLPAILEAQGQSYAVYREETRRDIALQIIQREIVSDIKITPRELEQNLAKESRTPDMNAQYNLSHILISVAANTNEEELSQRENRAKEVLAKAKAGQSFAELAINYSDSSTNIDGGSLGWRSGTQLPSIIADQIPSLKVGGVTDIIRTPSGFHLFKLNEKRGDTAGQQFESQIHARHILLKTNEIEDDNTLKQRLDKIRTRILNGEDFSSLAAVTSQDTGSAVQGGDLGWSGPGLYVPEFEKALATLNENEISTPFKTKYGWHIVQLLGRRTQDISEDVKRNKAYAALRESKAEEAIELWIRELRANAHIEILL